MPLNANPGLTASACRSRTAFRVAAEAGAEIYVQLSAFRTAHATCFLESDRLKLLAIIEGSFGTLERFDRAVADVLAPLLNSKASRDIASRLNRAEGRSGTLHRLPSLGKLRLANLAIKATQTPSAG